MKKVSLLVIVMFLVMGLSVAQGQILKIDFNSRTQGGGPNHQEGWSAYDAGHEVAADFDTKEYDGITITPSWPNTTANTVQQAIDRGAGNDANWNNDAGDIDLVTDWIGADTRTAQNGNGNWDGTTGTPTYFQLAIGGLAAGSYDWTSFHHDTENIHGTFAIWLSNDGGANFTQLADGRMTNSSPGGNPVADEVFVGPDALTLPSTYRMTITSNGTDDVVIRFAAYSNTAVHRQFFHMNGFILDIPRAANTPLPVNGAEGVSATGDLTLSWQTGMVYDPNDGAVINPDITGHYLFMDDGLGGELVYVDEIAADGPIGEYTVSDLGFDKTFTWMIEEKIGDYGPGDANNIPGNPWTFATEISIPIINVQPSSAAALPGETAIFEVDASSISEMTYTWFKSDDDVIDGADTAVPDGDGPVLEINLNADTATAVAESQGYYYCVLDNGAIVETDVVFLQVKRIIAQYSFEGNVEDSSLLANNGTWSDPAVEAYSAGVVGTSSVALSAADSNSIYVGLNAVPSSDPAVGGVQEGSAAYWIKTTNTGFQSIYGSFNTNDNTGFHLNINESSANGQIEVYIRGGAATELDAVLGGDSVLFDGNWHHIAFTWSASADEGVVYFDGVAVNTEGVNAAVMTPWEYPPTIGTRNLRGVLNGFVDGELDELVFYNYALPKEDVYDLYVAGPADWVCDVAPEFDWSGNCIVDLEDFAIFAEKWLECGRYPAEECNE